MPTKRNDPHNELFSTAHLKSGLKERAVKSTGITVLAQAAKLLLQITSITVLARLLDPADFGLVAMVTVFTGLALKFMEGGLSMATIQREEITHAQVSNLFWVNAGLGLGLSLLYVAIAPLVAWFYEEPKLIYIMVAMSAVFVIGGLSVQQDAILKRQMRFKDISLIDVASMAFGITGGILAGLNGLGYWALVVIPVVTYFVQTLMRWWYLRWHPSRPSRKSGVRPLIVFGMNLTGANFVGYVATNLTPLIVGYLGGAQPMGLYNRANTLTSMPSSQLLPPVMNVMQSTLARVASNPEQLRRTILSVMSKVALAAMFLTLTMATLGDWIVALFLGEGWEGAVPIFRMLAVFSLVEPVAAFVAITLVATGQAQAVFRWKLITLGILIISLAIGAFWGVPGVVAAYALSGVFVRLPFFLVYARRFLPVTLADFARTLMPALVCAGSTIACIVWLRSVVEMESPVAGLLVFTCVALILYLAVCLAIRQTRSELLDSWKLVRILTNGQKRSK